jgi:hypothetical protein
MNDSSPQKRYAARRLTPGWCGTTEVDERWMAEWVDFGIASFERYLANHARFLAWQQETGR